MKKGKSKKGVVYSVTYLTKVDFRENYQELYKTEKEANERAVIIDDYYYPPTVSKEEDMWVWASDGESYRYY